MKKYQVFVKAEIELDIEAKSEEEAKLKAEDEWYEALQYGGDFEIEDIYCYDEGEEE